MERRLRILEERKLAEGDGEEERDGEAEGGENGPPPAAAEEGKLLATTDQQGQGKKTTAAVAAAGKNKKKNAGVKKSKAQQVPEGRKGTREERVDSHTPFELCRVWEKRASDLGVEVQLLLAISVLVRGKA